MLCESLHRGLYFGELYNGHINMVHQLGNLGILIDYGDNKPDSVLQHHVRKQGHYIWQDYLVGGQPVTAPVDVNCLSPGEYQLRP